MGGMSKTKTKEITTAYWNIRKHHMGPIEISKLPQANCLGAEIDETCNWFREQCRFFSWRKIRGGEKSPVLMSKLENVCWPLSYRQNKIIWGFAAIFFSFWRSRSTIYWSDRCSIIKSLWNVYVCGRKIKWRKWKARKRELYVAFISKNIILRESLTVREGKMVTSNGR